MRSRSAASSGGDSAGASRRARSPSAAGSCRPAAPRGSAPPPMRSASVEPPVAAARGARCQLSSDGVAEPSTTSTPSQPAAPDREVARRITRAFLLLVRRVVLLVDDDQAEPRQRGEHREPGAEHEVGDAEVRARASCAAAAPASGRCAARRCGGRRSARRSAPQLRRQVDLGHQHQRLAAGRERLLGGAQVDLGLAAAGHAVQQHGARRRSRRRRGDRGAAPPPAPASAPARAAPRQRRRGAGGVGARRSAPNAVGDRVAAERRSSGGSTASATSPTRAGSRRARTRPAHTNRAPAAAARRDLARSARNSPRRRVGGPTGHASARAPRDGRTEPAPTFPARAGADSIAQRRGQRGVRGASTSTERPLAIAVSAAPASEPRRASINPVSS